MDAQETAVIYTTNDVYEAQIIKNALHNEGIAAEIDGGSQGGFVELVEIKVLVRAEDAERARLAIEQQKAASEAAIDEASFQEGIANEEGIEDNGVDNVLKNDAPEDEVEP